MKLTPEDLARIEDKKVANILRKIYTEKRTPTAREDAILLRAGVVQASGNEVLAGFAGTWDDLATALGVTRRAIQNWRDDPRYRDELEKRKALLARADGRHCVAEWLRFMVDHNLKRGAAAALVEGDAEEGEPGMVRPPPVGGNRVQWDLAIAAEDHRKKANANAVREGMLLEAAELEVPLGAMLATFQTKGASFPTRVASRLVGLRDAGEIEDRLREELDADFGDLQFAGYLAEDAVTAAIAAVPFDDATKALCQKLLFDGADRAALMDLAGAIAAQALRLLGRKTIADALEEKDLPDTALADVTTGQVTDVATEREASRRAAATVAKSKTKAERSRPPKKNAPAKKNQKARPQPARASAEVEAAVSARPRRKAKRRRR